MNSSVVKSIVLHLGIGGFLYASANIHPPTPKVMEVTLNSAIPKPDKAVSAVTVDQKQVEQKIAELQKKEKDKKSAEDQKVKNSNKRLKTRNLRNSKKKINAKIRLIIFSLFSCFFFLAFS